MDVSDSIYRKDVALYNPERFYDHLVSKLSYMNYQINTPYKGPESFIESSAITSNPDKVRLIMESFDKIDKKL